VTIADAQNGRRARPLMRLVGLVALTLGLAIAGYASGAPATAAHHLQDWVQRFSLLAPFVFICLFVVLNTVGLPLPVLAAAGGTTFGSFEGAALTLSAMTVTACTQFLLARHLGGEELRRRLGAQLGRAGLLLERRGALAVAGGRLLPGPFSELNLAAGLTPLTFRDFAVGTILGCAPKALWWSGVGAALA
jgi:uncharacterized membrane protein YdjX (TVP38/TMEM64 family)